MERYIKEYASAKIKKLRANKLMQADQAIASIEKALQLKERELITIDDAMQIIANA